MKRTVVALAALGVVIGLAGCSSDAEAPAVEEAKVSAEPTPTSTSAEPVDEATQDTAGPDALGACSLLVDKSDGGDEPMIDRIPEALTATPIDDEAYALIMEINTELRTAQSVAPDEMGDTIGLIRQPFSEIVQQVESGDTQIDVYTGDVMADVTEFMGQCVEAGFQVSDV